jgi:pilus assembly protein CpaF
LKAIREQVASSIELVVHQERMKDGTRKIVQVSEVQGMESDTIVMQDIFVYQHLGIKNGIVQGVLKPTGLRPHFLHKLIANGIEIPESVFEK